MVVLYAEPFQKRYQAPLVSTATIFVGVCLCVTIILPFVIGYSMNGFWLMESSFREQPSVQLKKEVIMTLQGPSTYLTYSTDPQFNKYRRPFLRVPTIQTSKIDQDFDGVTDYIDFIVSVPLLSTEIVQHVQLAFFVQYQLSKYLTLNMESLAIVDAAYPLPAASLHLEGDLVFKQRNPLPSWKSRALYSTPIMNATLTPNDPEYSSWDYVIGAYADRNDQTVFQCQYPIWKTMPSNDQPFVVSGRIRIGKNAHQYIPGLAEILKWAWIQYFSILAVVAAIILPLMTMLIKGRIFATYLSVDRVPSTQGPSYMPLSTNESGVKITGKSFVQYNF